MALQPLRLALCMNWGESGAGGGETMARLDTLAHGLALLGDESLEAAMQPRAASSGQKPRG